MVVMRTNHDVFVLQLLILSWKDSDDVMGSPLFRFSIREVVKESFLLFPLDNRLELQTTKLACYEL